MSVRPPRATAIVLAAGSSRRMGRPKQLLALGGRPLVQHAVDAAAGAAVAEIVVVLGNAADEIRPVLALPPNARIVVNTKHAAGQSTSLACGLAAAAPDADAAVVLLGDQPGIASALIDAVVQAFLAGDTPAVRPVWTEADGMRRPGHPVVLARALWPTVAALTGDQGARALFAAHPEWVREIAMVGAAPADIDEHDDYRRAVATESATGG